MARGDGTVLVLGASGFLGVHVARAVLAAARSSAGAEFSPGRSRTTPDAPARRTEPFDERGSEALVLGCRDASRLPRAAALGAVRVRAVDLADPVAIDDALEALSPARIVNCAAIARVDVCARDPDLARVINVEGPARIARWCARRRESGVTTRFVHVSTDLVFGGAPPRASGYREDDAVDPRSEYGRAKAAGEVAVLAEDASALVVRLPLLFGDSFGRGLGASDSLLAAIARGERPVLFTDEWRTPLDVVEAARALVELATGDASGVLHVAGAERMSRLDLALRVVRDRLGDEAVTRLQPRTRAEAGAADRPADVALDASRWSSARCSER